MSVPVADIRKLVAEAGDLAHDKVHEAIHAVSPEMVELLRQRVVYRG